MERHDPWLPTLALLVGTTLPLPPSDRRPPSFGVDKLLHALGHAWLSATLAGVFVRRGHSGRRAAVVAVLLSAGYGLALELLQRSVPGRRFEVGDVLAGTLGAALGVVVGGHVRPGSEFIPLHRQYVS